MIIGGKIRCTLDEHEPCTYVDNFIIFQKVQTRRPKHQNLKLLIRFFFDKKCQFLVKIVIQT